MRRLVLIASVAAVSAGALGGCGNGGGVGSAAGSSEGSRSVTVFAAASLTDTFTSIASRFEASHPGTRVVLSFGASSGLAESIAQGAPADVFASASPDPMHLLQKNGVVGTPRTFATNAMEIAVPRTNPGGVRGLSDLARRDVKVAVCDPSVPCGAAATEIFTRAKTTVRPVTREADVKATLTKVELGEVDAGIVYRTDVRAAGGRVRGVPVPASVNATTTYPIAAVHDSHHPELAEAFVAYVLSPPGERVLRDAGFGPA